MLATQIPFPYSVQSTYNYVARRNANPALQDMMGVTYERLAHLTERFGFTTLELPLNEEVRRHTEEPFWKNHPRGQKGKDMGKTLVAFQDTSEFLERFTA